MTKDKIIELLKIFGCEVAYKEKVLSEFFPSLNRLSPHFLNEYNEWRPVTELINPYDTIWIIEKMKEQGYIMQLNFGNEDGYIVIFKKLNRDSSNINRIEKQTFSKAVLYAAYDAVRRDLLKKEI